MNKHISLTIGIPVYGNEKNIGMLLHTLLSQKEHIVRIQQIILVCDQCSAQTLTSISKYTRKNKKIKVINNSERIGQTQAQNIIFAQATSDFVVLFEADTLPKGTHYLDKLLKPSLDDKEIGLIQGCPLALPGKSVVGMIFSSQYKIYQSCILSDSKTREWFSSGRGGRAFSKKIYQHLRWKDNVPEDLFALLWCKKRKIKTLVNDRVYCSYYCPQSLVDYKRAQQKIESGRDIIYRYFPEHLVNQLMYRPKLLLVRIILTFMKENIFLFLSYLFLKAFSQRRDTLHFTDNWSITTSTKGVIR